MASKKSEKVRSWRDELEEAKQRTADDAASVLDRFNTMFPLAKDAHKIPLDISIGGDWEETQNAVNGIDKQFKDQDMKNKANIGDVDVRVMQVGPNGLTDVTDRINPRDLRPDQIADFRTDGSMTIPLGPDGRIDKEAAMSILTRIMGTDNVRSGRNSSEESMRRMEAALAESVKILQHWK